MARRRFAHGSSTGVQQLQAETSRIIDACEQVQRVAHRVASDLDALSAPPLADELADSGPVVIAIERAQRRCTPS